MLVAGIESLCVVRVLKEALTDYLYLSVSKNAH